MQEMVLSIMEQFGYFGVFFLIAVENIFPPIPSEVILLFGGFMTTFTKLSVVGVIIAATLGSLLGAIVLYFIGKILNKERLKRIVSGKIGKVLRLKESDIDKADHWFDTKGNKTVFFCRFIPIVRSLISIPAGMSEMAIPKFLLYTIAGSLIWNSVLTIIGAKVGDNWESILGIFDNFSHIVLIILIVIFAIFLVSFGILFTLYFVKRNKNGINEFIENDNFVEEELLKNLKKDEVLKLGEIKDKEQDLQNLNRQFQNEFGLTEREFIERLEHNDNILKRYESQKVTSETNLKHYQNEFEKVETYVQELEDKLNEDTENYDKLKKNLDIIEKTEEFLQISSENLSKRYVEPVQKKFDEFYKKFFVNDKIVFNTNLNSLIEQSLQEDGYLSAGTLDLVNICKRFALIDLLYKKEKPFIILDDPFINLDDKNLKVAKEIVMEESKKYQIIFLTCHSSRQL